MSEDFSFPPHGQESGDTSFTQGTSKEIATDGSIGTETVIGQAGETVVVNRPAQGQTIEIQSTPGATYVLNFPSAAAQIDGSADGQDLILGFDDDGNGTIDSRIVFLDLAAAAAENPPTFQIAGTDISADILLAALGDPLEDVAAGPAVIGGGTSTYSDDHGQTVGLLDAQGVIPGTELQFGLIDLENEILITEEEDGPPLADPVLTPAQQGELPPDLLGALQQLGFGGAGAIPDGWMVLGNVSTSGAAFGITPPEGLAQLNLFAEGASDADIETFFGLSAGTLDGLPAIDNATDGSAIKTMLTVAAGDTVTFQFNFLDLEQYDGNEGFNDFAFVVFGSQIVKLADVLSTDSGGVETDIGTVAQTGYNEFIVTFTTGGTFVFGLGMMNEDDQSVDSALLVDNIVHHSGDSATFLTGFEGDGGEGGAPEIVFFKQLDVSGEIGDDDGGVVADFGGSDGETALEDLVFTLQSNPTYGQLILVSGGTASFLNPGDTFSSADTVWWIATQDDIDAFLSGEGAPAFLPDVDFDYSVTDEAGNSAAAPVTITIPREVSPPEVFISLPEEVDCLEEDSTLGDAANQVTVGAAPQGDDLLSEVVITGLQADWTYDFSGLDTDGAGTEVTVDTSVAGQVTISFANPANASYSGTFSVQPPDDSDVDHPTLTVEATAVEPSDPSLTASGDATLDIHVDANADGGEGSAGDDGDPDHLSVSLSVQDSDGDADSVFETGEIGTLTVSATFDDYQDGSETHTVTVTAPTGFAIGGTVGSLPAGVSLLSNDGTTLVLSVETVDGVGSFTADFAVTNVSAVDGEALFEAEARAVETTTDDVECDPSDADNIAVVTDEANATVANVAPPLVALALPDEVDCLEEDSGLDDAANQVTVSVTPQGDDLLSEIVITGLQADWDYDFDGLDTDGVGTEVTVDTSVAGQVTISFANPANASYSGTFSVQPPADSDVDHPTLTVEATAVEPSDPSLTASGNGTLDIHVDANADGGEGSAGDDGDADHLSVSVSVADSTGDADDTFETGESGTVTVSATFDDYQDGSERHTVTLTAPAGFLLGAVVGDLPEGVSQLSNDGTTLVLSVDSTDGEGPLGVGGFTASFQVTNVSAEDGPALFTVEARAVETSTGDDECDDSDADNVAVVTGEAPVTVENAPPEFLIVGENVDDNDAQTAEHAVHFPTQGPNPGEITGDEGADVLIGDFGGGELVGKTMNLALVLDTSDSMSAAIDGFGGATTRIAALNQAVDQLLQELADTPGLTARVHLISFATDVKGQATFNIIENGVVNDAQLQAAKNFVIGLGTNPDLGATNYEAGLNAALQWFTGPGNILENPDINKTIFVSDGLPNVFYIGNGTTTSPPDPTATVPALEHVLGTFDDPANPDNVSEVALLQGTFNGTVATLDAVGIDASPDALANLNQVDGTGAAENITTAEQLAQVLSNLAAATDLEPAGNDVINGAGAGDLIFGDVLFTDLLAVDQSIDVSPGSGWEVIQQMVTNDTFSGEEDIIAFLRDPLNQDTYQFWRESVNIDGEGREGGNDTINAGAGDDIVYGQEGSDIIDGGAGMDLIVGGTGNDTLTGGADADVFLWTDQFNVGEVDTVTDFDIAEGDVLDLTALLQGVAPTDTGTELADYLDFSFAGTDTTITIDVDGSGGDTDLTIVCQDVDLTSLGGSDAEIINSMIASGNLEVGTA